MFPSTFYQPFCHASQPSYVVAVEPTCYSSPSVFDLQQLISHQTRQRRAAQVAAAAAAAAHCRAREREAVERRLALARERERALEQERRRRILARREYERHLARQEEEQACRAYCHAERQARRQVAQRQEETSFAAFINSLFHQGLDHDEPEGDASAEDSDVSAEEDQDQDQGPELDSLFSGMGVGSQTGGGNNPTVSDTPREEQPSSVAEPRPLGETAALDDIQQEYARHQVRVERLETLDNLHARLERLTSSFIFPSSLDFQQQQHQPKASSAVVPPLEYTSTNTPYHAHAHALLELLVDADAVSSEGDDEVRTRRKQFVRLVEAQLDGLEREKARVWREGAQGGR